MTQVDIGLFHYLLSDSVAAFGTINESIPNNGSLRNVAFIDKSFTRIPVIIPNSIEYENKKYTVTTIGGYSFRYSEITYLFIPRSVVIIFDYAVDWVQYLEKIEFERDSQLKEIKASFLVNSTVTRLEIPAYVTSIGTHFLTYNTKIRKIFFFGENEVICQKNLTSYKNLNVYVHSYYKSTKFCDVDVISSDVFPSLAPITCNHMTGLVHIPLFYLSVIIFI